MSGSKRTPMGVTSTTNLGFALAVATLMISTIAATATAAPIAQTQEGAVEGVDTRDAYEYRGVPFAAPPLGQLRWRPPVDAEPWAPDVYAATTTPPVCPQLPQFYPQSEDCLYLNVFVPRGRVPRGGYPVMVFLTGGAFTLNGAATQVFNGSAFANATSTIIVVPNYRLGILGLMGHPDFMADSGTFGNYLLMDQVHALKWVKRNIGGFGGDADRVTLFGESAGSISIGIQLALPHSAGLFRNAIMESGAPVVLDPPSVYSTAAAQVQAALGCPTGAPWEDTVTCMRAANVSTIMAVQASIPYFVLPRPAVDGVFILDQPLSLIRRGLHQRNVAVIAGFQTNESNIYVGAIAAYRGFNSTDADFEARIASRFGADSVDDIAALYDVSGTPGPFSLPSPFSGMGKADTDFGYACPARNYMRLLAEGGSRRLWFYRFNRAAPFAPAELGAYHTGELAYLFGHPCLVPVMNAQPPLEPFGPSCLGDEAPLWDAAAHPADYALSRTMMDVWAAFAATGNPNGRGVFARAARRPWLPYAAALGYPNAVFDANDATGKAHLWTENRVNEERCDYWVGRMAPYCGDDVCNEAPASCPFDCLWGHHHHPHH
ncbi:Carboxylic ester hydrolase [Pandoravirus quercus]|uniref:Carboxylic ester hydrolase n=2 Tax=Pandoravirus TaxID=2060084 RepID=A0A2U7UAE9_9VIRU|nr:Carboxylic ester hydrolase [Pandoravirus quercus]AVK75421.1 Carboxylic ester hydrolase [Pandoravirus quercus]QBZ81601.1 Abhydrolase superfamily domain containing protein [Pandoravirus celtis]